MSNFNVMLEELEHGAIPPPYLFFEIGGQRAFPAYDADGSLSTKMVTYLCHHLSPEVLSGGSMGLAEGIHTESDSLWYVIHFRATTPHEDLSREVWAAIDAMGKVA